MTARRRKDKIASAAHIKRHTEGTSNEISFSVLDAAKMELEGKLQHPETSRLGGISLFTLPGHKRRGETPARANGLPLPERSFSLRASRRPAAGGNRAAWTSRGEMDVARGGGGRSFASSSPEYEIARRKSRRKLYRLMAAVTGVVIVGALVAGAGMVAFGAYRAHESNVGSLKDAIGLIVSADETIVDLDKLVSNPVDPSQQDNAEQLASSLPETRSDLDQARAAVGGLADEIVVPRDKEAASSAVNSIDARIEMIEHGEKIVEASIAAINARLTATEAWNDILSADGFARDAAQLANDATEESIAASSEKTQQAIAALNDASYLLSLAESSYDAIDLSAYQDYVEKRIEALEHALASNGAFLVEDTQTATAENDAYNIADAEAAILAEDLPASIGEAFAEAFERSMGDDLAAYEEARTRATSTDAYLRTYTSA